MKKATNENRRPIIIGILFAIFLFFNFSPAETLAQSCKPDYSKVDKIEKKKIDAWACELFETSFGGQMMGSSAVHITFAIGRMDNAGFVQLQLQKEEESTLKTLVEPTLKAVKGDEFYFGIKNGDPLKFAATEVTNEIKKNDILKKWVTTVILLSEVKNEDLPALKSTLANKIIDAVRIKLENGVVIEQSVKEKKGNKMMEKAICFFNYQQQNGSVKSEDATPGSKNKPQNKGSNDAAATSLQNPKLVSGKNSDNNIVTSEASNSGEQFEGVWISETKKRVTVTITKINPTNYEVKQIMKSGPMKRNMSPCPTFELINNELVCKEFKIIFLPEKNSIYFKGDDYKKQ